MSRPCYNTPLQGDARRRAQEHEKRLVAELQDRLPRGPPTNPLVAFSVLFRVSPDPAITKGVKQLYQTRRVERRRGWIYVFYSEETCPDGHVLKVGLTTRDPYVRVSEWARQLREPAHLLYAYQCRAPFLAERILHKLLRCQWIPNRIDNVSLRELVEYFCVKYWRRLQYLVKAVVRHVDYVSSSPLTTCPWHDPAPFASPYPRPCT